MFADRVDAVRRVAIVVVDGLATGATMIAALADAPNAAGSRQA